MNSEEVASTFRSARRSRQALAAFPGEPPGDLASAYAVQEAAIAAWPDRVAGWKVAMIAPAWRDRFQAPRLAGPVFAKTILSADPDPAVIAPIAGGFAAVEAEFAIRLADDVPAEAAVASEEGLLSHIEGVYAAIEFAGSPLAAINELGPGSVISDFGNNSGLLVGPRIPNFGRGGLAAEISRTEIDGVMVGEGSAARVPDGPFAALRFLIASLAERGRMLRAGDWVSSGMTTGIHPIRPGNVGVASFRDGLAVRFSVT